MKNTFVVIDFRPVSGSAEFKFNSVKNKVNI